MDDVLVGVVIGIFLLFAVVVLACMILRSQKKLDAPYGGILVVEKIEGETTGVYFQAVNDPESFKDGQDLKLKVKVVTSQL